MWNDSRYWIRRKKTLSKYMEEIKQAIEGEELLTKVDEELLYEDVYDPDEEVVGE